VVGIAAKLAEGLGAVHQLDCVHRNVKAGNVLVDPVVGGGFEVHLLGMGMLRSLRDPEDEAARSSRSFMERGTPAYLAPEALYDASDADQRSDIYSLGVVVHLLATKRLPFTGGSIIEQLVEKERGVAPAVKEPRFRALIAAMLAPRPRDRPRTMFEVGAHLAEL
jgi:serine/threonine-protein kinase